MTGTKSTDEKLISWCEHGKMLVCEICALKTEVKLLKQQVNTLTFELKIKDAELKSVDKLGVKYQRQAYVLTKVIGEINRILIGDDVDAFDTGECRRLITEALQSIKESPREEQTP